LSSQDDVTALTVGGQQVLIASLEDIIRSKEIADRPADRAALPELRSLLAQQQAPAADSNTSSPTPAIRN
jgi:hypothetical protein